MIKKIYLAALLIFVAGIFLTGCALKPDSNSSAADQSQAADISGSRSTSSDSAGEPTQTDNQNVRLDKGEGGVQVEAIWITPEYLRVVGNEDMAKKYDLNNNIIFEISMSTHMGDLTKYPIAQKAELTVDGGVVEPARWDITSNTAHHPQGILVFPAGDSNLLKSGSRLELNLRELEGIPERKFSWQQK